MTLDDFLDIIHESAELQTFGIVTPENPNSEDTSEKENRILRRKFEKFLNNHSITYHKIVGKFAGLNEVSYLLENVNYDTVLELSEDFNQTSFIHVVRDPQKVNEPIVYEKGDSKYIFRYYEKQNGSYNLVSETNYILVDKTLSDNYSYFKDQPQRKWSIRFFQDFNPKQSNYVHPYEPPEDFTMQDGVKEETIKKIREVINPRYRRLN